MAALRGIANRAARRLAKAKAENRSEYWMSGDILAGAIDREGSARENRARKAYGRAMALRSRGPIGAARLALAPKEAKERLRTIKEIRGLREKGYDVSNHLRTLINGLKPEDKVRMVSFSGRIREGHFIGIMLLDGKKAVHFRTPGGQTKAIPAERLMGIAKIPGFTR